MLWTYVRNRCRRERYATSIADDAFDLGLLIDVVNKSTIRMLPPFTVTRTQINDAVSILDQAIKRATA